MSIETQIIVSCDKYRHKFNKKPTKIIMPNLYCDFLLEECDLRFLSINPITHKNEILGLEIVIDNELEHGYYLE